MTSCRGGKSPHRLSAATGTLHWVSRRAAPGPTTDGRSLELTVECRTSRNASRGRLHPIHISPDWTVDTPHDLGAERIAAALGGYSSCLELVDQIIPAVARSMGLLIRTQHLPMHRSEDRKTWIVPKVRRCRCVRAQFWTAQSAAEHLRSPEHLSRQHKVSARQFTEVIAAIRRSGDPDPLRMPDPPPSIRSLVLEATGVRDLWEAGIHPLDIPEMASHARSVEEALPTGYFLGIRYGDVDFKWLAKTIEMRPDPSVAAWLAWTPEQSTLRTGDVGAWLELGLGRRQIETLTAEFVRPQDAYDLAAPTARTAHSAASDLAMWAAAGCHPTVEHMRLLDRHGLGSTFQPSRAAVDRLASAAERLVAPPDRTELAVLLALEGTCRNVESVLVRGIRTAQDLVTGSQHAGESA